MRKICITFKFSFNQKYNSGLKLIATVYTNKQMVFQTKSNKQFSIFIFEPNQFFFFFFILCRKQLGSAHYFDSLSQSSIIPVEQLLNRTFDSKIQKKLIAWVAEICHYEIYELPPSCYGGLYLTFHLIKQKCLLSFMKIAGSIYPVLEHLTLS